MAYLAEKKIVHCDLAARNVLMRNHNHVEVADFGLATVINENTPDMFSLLWAPVELLRIYLSKV